MQGLKDRALDSVVLDLIGTKPLMAMCVGMQILAKYGEESSGVQALGVFPGQITQFSKSMKTDAGASLKVPHMGWNKVIQQPHPMWSGIPDRTRFYFVHSYCYADASADCVIGRCEYGPPLRLRWRGKTFLLFSFIRKSRMTQAFIFILTF